MKLENVVLYPAYNAFRVNVDGKTSKEVVSAKHFVRDTVGAVVLESKQFGSEEVADTVLAFNNIEDINVLIKELEAVKMKLVYNLELVKISEEMNNEFK